MRTIEDKVNDAMLKCFEIREQDVFEGAGASHPDIYYLFLYTLAKEMEPSLSIELGTWHGGSAWCMKKGFPDGHVITFDIANEVWDGFRNSGAQFVQTSSIEGSYGIKDESVDILFIDTIHDGNLPKAEFEAWLKKLKPGCVVLFDDIELNAQMKSFWEEFNPVGFKKMNAKIHSNAGFGIIYREAA